MYEGAKVSLHVASQTSSLGMANECLRSKHHVRIDVLACYPWFSAYYIKVLQGRRNALDLADGRAKESGIFWGHKTGSREGTKK